MFALIASWGLLCNGTFFEWLRSSLSRNVYDSHRLYRPESISPVVFLYIAEICVLTLVCLIASAIFDGIAGLLFWILLFGIAEGIFVISVTLHTIYARATRYFFCVVGRGLATPLISIALIQGMSNKGEAVTLAVISAGLIIGAVNLLFDPAMRQCRRAEINRENFNAIFRFGLPIAFSASTSTLSGQIDRIIVGALLGPTVLGIYAVICDVAQKPISVLITAINTVAYPYYLRATERNGLKDGFRRLEESGNYLVAATFGIPILCILFGDLVLRFFYSDDIPEYGPIIFGVAAATALLRGLLGAFYYPAFQLARITNPILRISVILMVASLAATGIGGITLGVYGVAFGCFAAVLLGVGIAQYGVGALGDVGLFNKRNLALVAAHAIWIPVYVAVPWQGVPSWLPAIVYTLTSYATVALVVFRTPRIGGGDRLPGDNGN